MATPSIIPVSTLRQLLRYEPETGFIFWKERPLELFNAGRRNSAKQNQNIWNSRYADRPALYTPDNRGYQKGSVLGLHCQRHRAIWALVHGRWPTGLLDHISGDKLDNRAENLREVTPAENSRNMARARNNTSGQTGVSWRPRSNRWRAYIRVSGKMEELGEFTLKSDAIAVRKQAEQIHGFHANHGRPAVGSSHGTLV